MSFRKWTQILYGDGLLAYCGSITFVLFLSISSKNISIQIPITIEQDSKAQRYTYSCPKILLTLIIIIIIIIIIRCSVLLQRFNAVLLHDSMPACDRMEF